MTHRAYEDSLKAYVTSGIPDTYCRDLFSSDAEFNAALNAASGGARHAARPRPSIVNQFRQLDAGTDVETAARFSEGLRAALTNAVVAGHFSRAFLNELRRVNAMRERTAEETQAIYGGIPGMRERAMRARQATNALQGFPIQDAASAPYVAITDTRHVPMTGTHTHDHAAFGAADHDDGQHLHQHTHDGDGDHDHDHALPGNRDQ